MRELFQKQLEALHVMLIEMGALCEQVIERTYKVILSEDKAAAAEIIEKDSVIDLKEREIESACLKASATSAAGSNRFASGIRSA